MKYLLTILILLTTISTNAELITDGTLNQQINLPGPNFQISPDLGEQHGNNLFHSFQDFNLNNTESATFSGPDSVQNIINRVTGGNPSNIDGLIRSTIPDANLYFLNPYGIMFGPNAKLDISGSFHVSTADYLRLGNDGKFNARNPTDSLLTIAPVITFGFLTDSPAAITILDSQLKNKKELSIVAGDIDINVSKPFTGTEKFFDKILKLQTYPPQLFSLEQINLLSVAESGEVAVDNFNLHGGQININKAHISAISSGNILIRAGSLKLIDSIIGSTGVEDSGFIDIFVNNLELQGKEAFSSIHSNAFGTSKGSIINLQTDDFTINKGWVLNSTFGVGEGGDTFIKVANNFTMIGKYIAEVNAPSGILSLTFDIENAGNLGNINIKAGQMNLEQGATILNRTLGEGNSGTINISVTGAINITGEDARGIESSITGQSGDDDIFNFGNAADINIKAQQMLLADGARIDSETLGFGTGGNIKVNIADTLTISGQDSSGSPSAISASAVHIGNAGKVDIIANKINLIAGGAIYSATVGSGNAGRINIQADEILAQGGFDKPWETGSFYNSEIRFLPSGIFTTSAANGIDTGDAGQIKINARQIKLLDGGEINSGTLGGGDGSFITINVTDNIIADGKYTQEDLLFYSGIVSGSTIEENYAGNAGNLMIQANNILLSNEGVIVTNARNASGGNININTNNLLYLNNTNILTSVNGGDGDGGNINISNSKFLVLDNAQIKAQAYAGRGGNININSEHFIKTPISLVNASSQLGIDGNITIDSPDIDMKSFLTILPDNFIDVSSFMKIPCGHKLAENLSSFVIKPSEGSPNSPDDLLPSGFNHID